MAAACVSGAHQGHLEVAKSVTKVIALEEAAGPDLARPMLVFSSVLSKQNLAY